MMVTMMLPGARSALVRRASTGRPVLAAPISDIVGRWMGRYGAAHCRT
jgi:hypothetical protein